METLMIVNYINMCGECWQSWGSHICSNHQNIL